MCPEVKSQARGWKAPSRRSLSSTVTDTSACASASSSRLGSTICRGPDFASHCLGITARMCADYINPEKLGVTGSQHQCACHARTLKQARLVSVLTSQAG